MKDNGPMGMTLSTMPSVLDAAPRFPVRIYWRGGSWHKQPRFKGWQQHATNDPAQLEWWRDHYDPNFGIHLGTMLVAIDADRHGIDGVAALAELSEGRDWPAHPVVATAGSGEHHIFRQPTMPLGQGKGALPGGIDVRGNGGWVVAPGSRRPDGAQWRLVVDAKPPKLPRWLELLIRARPTYQGPGSFHGPLMDDPNRRELPKPLYFLLHRLTPDASRHERRRVAGILGIALWRQHHRNDGLNIAAYCLRELVPGVVSHEAAVELLTAVANANGYVAKDGAEAAVATILSGLGPDGTLVGHEEEPMCGNDG